MKVKVDLILTREEVEVYRKEWKECNPGEITDEKIRENFLEDFWADKHEYLCSADINCYIVEDMSKVVSKILEEL